MVGTTIPKLDLNNFDVLSFNTWKEEYDKILISWRKLSAINMWLSLASKSMYERINNWLAYPSIILSIFMSIGIIGIDTCNTPLGTYIIASVNLVAAILTTINKHMGAAEKSHEFYVRSKEYYAIIREIDYILSLNKNDRPEAYEVIVRLRADLEKIIDSQLDFPVRIIREYERKFRPLESSIFVDLEAEKLDNQTAVNKPAASIPDERPMPLTPQGKHWNKFNRIQDSHILTPYQLYGNVPYRKSDKGDIASSQPPQRKSLETLPSLFILKNDDVESASTNDYIGK